MKSRNANTRNVLAAILTVVLTGGLSEALASSSQTKTKTNTTPPAKVAPAPVKAATPAPAQKGVATPANPQAHPGGVTPGVKPVPPAGVKPVPPPGVRPVPPVGVKPENPHAPYSSHPGEVSKPVPGGRTSYQDPRTGRTVVTNKAGQVTRIEGPRGIGGQQMVINRNPRGGREVVSGRPGNRVVSYGGSRGFVERPMSRQGYISRTYVVHGRTYAHVYHEYRYRGVAYYGYVPGVYYAPGFYGWAGGRWGAPVAYGWAGPMGAGWFNFYGGYFAPYPMYASADLWLTDYLLAENLKLAYDNQQQQQQGNPEPTEAPAASAAQTPLSPDTKAMIADEVRQQIAAEKAASLQPAAATSGQPPAGDTMPSVFTQKFFVVSANLDVTANGQACSLTPGDIIQRKATSVANDGTVPVEVISSKAGDCPADSQAGVELATLQEMHNQFQEQVDAGLKTLADGQVRGVTSPAAGARPVPEGTADAAPDAATQITTADSNATNLEAQVRQNN